MFKLTVEKGEPAGAVYELRPGENTLGRSRSAAIRLSAPDVSGLHARIHVAGDGARIENLSQFGTRIDGVPVTGEVALADGQRIEVGKATLLRVGLAAAEAEAKTGEGGALEPPAAGVTRGTAASAATRPPPLTQGATRMEPGESEMTGLFAPREALTGEASEEGATRAMQTRAATPEEIALLRINEEKRVRRRLFIGVAAAVVALVLVFVFRPRKAPPETVIGWPQDAGGEYQDAFEAALTGGRKDGGYDMMYPGNGTFRKTPCPGGFVLEGRVGRKFNVPMRIVLQEENEVRLLAMSRKEMVDDWIRQASESGGKWNFDPPSPMLRFFGSRNGVPYTRVTYSREGDGSWFGTASIARHGCRRIVARFEVPSDEQARSEELMSATPIWVSEAFEDAQWEGDLTMANLSVEVALAQARKDAERMAPATWVAQEGLLVGLLTKAVQAGNREAETEALQLLVKLREKQALWFNGQQLAFDDAISRGEPAKARKLAEFAKAVFSNVEDLRYSSVRKWEAEQ